MLKFDIEATDGRARAGTISTDHGSIETPAITLNYTTALVKGGFQPWDIIRHEEKVIMLRNTFWMMVGGVADGRDGTSGWTGPLMADSGGFQMTSLIGNLRTDPTGITLLVDGVPKKITPEMVVTLADKLGVDMIMPLDYVIPVANDNIFDRLKSVVMTIVWHGRSRGIKDENLYYIVQGGLARWARRINLWDAVRQLEKGIPAVAIGGLAEREPRLAMYSMIDFCTQRLPENKPRHMLGVCKPVDILQCIKRGMDTFDGIAATREGRHGRFWIKGGKRLDIYKAIFAEDLNPLEPGCPCPVCTSGATRSDIRERYKAGDMEARRQMMSHNWYHNFYVIKGARQAIKEHRLEEYIAEYMAG